MAHTIESPANIPANQLRRALDDAERRIVSVDADSVEALLVLFDRIEQLFDDLATTSIDLRPEEGRWQSLLNRLSTRPGPITRAASRAGGLAALRAKHPPAEGPWWHLDTIVFQRRRKSAVRVLATVLIVVGGLVFAYWGINTLFPPNPDAVLMVETTSQLDSLVRNEQWQDALDVVEGSLESLPEEPELWIWKTVLLEQLGDRQAANDALNKTRGLLGDRADHFWILLGNTRYQVGNLDGARDAANQALALDDENPQAYFLLGSVAEAEGDIVTAVDMFNKTFELAQDSDPQLAVIARVRLGQMLQQPSFGTASRPESPEATTPDATPTP